MSYEIVLYFMHYLCVVIILINAGYVSLHFLPILLVTLGFHLSLGFFVCVSVSIVFTFSVICFKFNVISKDLIIFV